MEAGRASCLVANAIVAYSGTSISHCRRFPCGSRIIYIPVTAPTDGDTVAAYAADQSLTLSYELVQKQGRNQGCKLFMHAPFEAALSLPVKKRLIGHILNCDDIDADSVAECPPAFHQVGAYCITTPIASIAEFTRDRTHTVLPAHPNSSQTIRLFVPNRQPTASSFDLVADILIS